jgi:hypothetical protein
MCRHCDAGRHQPNLTSRRTFLKATASTGIAAAGLFGSSTADAQATAAPSGSGKPGRRYVIRGGAVLSMDPGVGDFTQAAVLVEGKKIVAVGPKLEVPGAAVIDARGKIVRSAMTLQRALVNQTAIEGRKDLPELLTSRDVIRFATLQGAKDLKLDRKVGSLTPGKEATSSCSPPTPSTSPRSTTCRAPWSR